MSGYRMVHDVMIGTCVYTILCSCKKQKKRVSSLVKLVIIKIQAFDFLCVRLI